MTDEAARLALAEIEQMPFSMVNDSESLRHTIRTMQSIAHTALRAIPPIGTQAPVAKRCREILDWHTTGLLVNGEVRKLAAELAAQGMPEYQILPLAEKQTADEAMRIVAYASTPALVAQREALEEQAFKTAEILESDTRLNREYRDFLAKQLRAALATTATGGEE